MYAKTVYYRNIIKPCTLIYLLLSNTGIPEVDTSHLQHWNTDFGHTNLNEP